MGFFLSIRNFSNLEWLPIFWVLVVLKCYSYEIRISNPLVNVSIRFSPLLDFVLKTFSDVEIRFILFEIVVALLWETMTFYWIIWGPHNGDPTGITLLKYNILYASSILYLYSLLKHISVEVHYRNCFSCRKIISYMSDIKRYLFTSNFK